MNKQLIHDFIIEQSFYACQFLAFRLTVHKQVQILSDLKSSNREVPLYYEPKRTYFWRVFRYFEPLWIARTDSFGLASKAASWLGVVGLLNFAGIGEIIKGLNDHLGN